MRQMGLLGLAVSFAFGLTACGGGGGGDSGTPAPSRVTWNGNTNGSTVLDGNGAPFYFSSSTGCMYSTVSGYGPAGFCLTTPQSASGPTGCSNPGSNSQCDAASFRVILTYTNGIASACIAVLGAPVSQTYLGPTGTTYATYSQTQPLGVTDTGSSFAIQTYKTFGATSSNAGAPTSYVAYWNAQIPGCGGGHAYEGAYTLHTSATCSNFGTVTTASFNITQPVVIDGQGFIADNGTQKIFGGIGVNGTSGGFTGNPSNGSGGSTKFTVYTVTGGAPNGSGKWVLSGTYDPALVPVSCGVFTGQFTVTED